jgi:16S rRNA (uracil1498-N3)-methyltransferase
MATTQAMRTLLVQAPRVVGEVEIGDEEAHQGLHVLRLRLGDSIRLADGAGRCGLGRVMLTSRHSLRVAVEGIETLEKGPSALLSVACAAPKGDRFDDLVRTLTELGVGRILPLSCARSDRIPTHLDRQRRVAGEALKQCRRGHLPTLGPVVDIRTLAAWPEPLIILDRAGSGVSTGEPRAITLVIGPEGGLTEEEVGVLAAAGAQTMRLAGHVLRIETAAIAAAAVWAAAWENRSS